MSTSGPISEPPTSKRLAFTDHDVTKRGNRTEAYQQRIEASLAKLAQPNAKTYSHEELLARRDSKPKR